MPDTIRDELQQRFGLVPNFYLVAPTPAMGERIWNFACLAYLDNPLPSLFKERLFVWLSRFCEARYCLARHVGFLLGLGPVAGDASCRAQPVEAVLELLKRPVPRGEALQRHVAALEQPLAQLPPPDSDAEWSIFACATQLFCEPGSDSACRQALMHAIGPEHMQYLQELLAFIHLAHNWSEMHPELRFEDDITRLLANNRELNTVVLDHPQARCNESWHWLNAELETLRQEKKQLMRASGMRIQQDLMDSRLLQEISNELQRELADSQLLHEISNELIGEQRIDTLYGKLISAGSRVMHAFGGSIQALVTGPDGAPELDLLAQCGLDPEAMAFWKRVRIGSESSCGEALAHGRRVVVSDVLRCPFMAGTEDLVMYMKSNIHAVQTTPLRARDGTMVGCISTYWPEPHNPNEHELQMFDILAREAADLIERTRVDEALRASEERCRRALKPQNVGVVFFDSDGRIGEANDAFLRMSQYTHADLEAGRLRLDDMTPPEWQAVTQQVMIELWSKGYTPAYEKEYLRKDGSRWWGLSGATRLSESEAVKFVIDITARKEAEQALKESDERKDVFLATLAHELRNPLAPISNVVQLLHHPNGRRRADQLMDIVDRQVHQIVRLVDDLFEVSRITRGKIRINRAPVDLAEIVHDAVETSRPLVERGQHVLAVSLPTAPLVLDADRVRLTQALANLLNNAATYTRTPGHIWLEVHTTPCDLVLSVRDDGIGIAPDQLTRIFDPFMQIDLDSGPDNDGLGIGLTMVRSLVEMHGGTVTAHSEGPGSGSEFTVRLPLSTPEHADGATAAPTTDGIPLPGQRILIVDDNRDAADSLGLLLREQGAEIRVAYGGEAALEALESFDAQAVLLDLGMSGMDGYEVAQRLRRDPRLRGLRIAALTGWGQEGDRHHTRACGFDFHLTKPVALDALKAWLSGDGAQ